MADNKGKGNGQGRRAEEMFSTMLATVKVLVEELKSMRKRVDGSIEAFTEFAKESREPNEKLQDSIQELTNSVKELLPDKNLSTSIDEIMKFTKELNTVDKKLANAAIKLLESTDKLRESDEKISSVIEDVLSSMKRPRVPDKYDIALNRAALEAVDGKPAFVGLIHLEHSSKSDEDPHVWRKCHFFGEISTYLPICLCLANIHSINRGHHSPRPRSTLHDPRPHATHPNRHLEPSSQKPHKWYRAHESFLDLG